MDYKFTKQELEWLKTHNFKIIDYCKNTKQKAERYYNSIARIEFYVDYDYVNNKREIKSNVYTHKIVNCSQSHLNFYISKLNEAYNLIGEFRKMEENNE